MSDETLDDGLLLDTTNTGIEKGTIIPELHCQFCILHRH